MARTRDTRTLDLLNWQPPPPPPSPAVKYETPAQVKAAGLRSQIIRAMRVAEEESGKNRDEIAAAMTEYLGEDVTKSVLDQYMSESRTDYTINVVRFVALLMATGDRRPLTLLAEQFGLILVERRWEGAIQEAQLRADKERIEEQLRAARHKWQGGSR